MKALQKKQRPLIRYAGSAAETSIGSKPIGSELGANISPQGHFVKPKSMLLTPRHLDPPTP